LLAVNPHSDEQYLAIVFGGGYYQGRTPLQCGKCYMISLERCNTHACLDATGQSLTKKVRTPRIGGRYVCLVCFYVLSHRMQMVGHLLTHTLQELQRIGISDELVRKYIAE